jgi:hypothetical protein
MARHLLAALVLLVVLPEASSAQVIQQPAEAPRLRITPFVGWAPVLRRVEERASFSIMGPSSDHVVVEHASGVALGLSTEHRITPQLALSLGGGITLRGLAEHYSTVTDEAWVDRGSHFAFARAVAQFRLQETVTDLQMRSVNAALFAGPAFMRELPSTDANRGDGQGMNLFGVALGATTEVPVAGLGVTLHFGAEDTIFWWDNTELARRADVYNETFGVVTQTAVATGASHQWILRAGFSISR